MVTSTCSGGVVRASSSTRSIPKRSMGPEARPPMQRSFSIDTAQPSSSNNKPMTRSLRHCASGLSHGFQIDLQQAVQLEKQELCKLGMLPPPIAVQAPLPKVVSPEEEEEEDDTPQYWLYRQQRLVRRAASFTSGQRGCPPPMPCSPPVAIPQHHEAQRRYSAAAGLGEHMTHGVDAEQLQHMSKSQCEARLWDEFWNYKLSFESRESFEASGVHLKTRGRASSDHLDAHTAKTTLLKYRSESSMTSTADTVNEDEEEVDGSVGPEEDEHVHRYGDVFEMDDL